MNKSNTTITLSRLVTHMSVIVLVTATLGVTGVPVLPAQVVTGMLNISAAGNLLANRYTQPARPGQLVVLWGTGLTAHRGVDTPQVLVGDTHAPVHYAGPSECCAGVDHVIFEVPAGIEGCHVPVMVRLDDALESNSPTLAIAAGEGPCSDPHGLPPNLLEKFESAGALDFGYIVGNARDPGRVPTAIELAYGYTDPGSPWLIGSFWRGLPASATLPPLGTCYGDRRTIRTFSSGRPFDAGAAVNLRGPHGLTQIPRIATDVIGSIAYSAIAVPDRLERAEYVLDNGEGSSRIGPFQTTFTLPDASFEWTNKEGFDAAAIENGLQILWNGGDPTSGYVVISATLIRQHEVGDEELSSLTCVEKVEEKSFTLPSSVLASAPEADVMIVRVGYVFYHRFPVPGLDFGEFSYSSVSTARLPLRQ